MSLQDVANRTGCPIRFLVGVRAVESGGNPAAVRFEPHLFKRHLPDKVVEIPRGTLIPEAAEMRAAARNAGKVPYTPGMHGGKPRSASSTASETVRSAFEFARKIDALVAVLASSWGSYQQLGGNFPHALERPMRNASEANAAVAAFDADPSGVSDKLLAAWLLQNEKALEAAKRGDVAEFVRRYNGATNPIYVQKMQAAFAKFDAGTLKP